MSRPPFVIRSADVPEEEGWYPPPFDAEKLSFGRDLGRAAGSRALGAQRERIPPGRRTSFTHAHLREEELIYVLAGTPSVRWFEPGERPQEHVLAPGDLVVFPGGTGIAHTFVNRSDGDAEVLVIGERRPGERGYYPEDEAYFAWRSANRPDGVWPGGPDPAARLPVTRIETERLVLRCWEPADAPSFAALVTRNLDHLKRWLTRVQKAPTVEEQLAHILRWRPALAGGDLVYGLFEPDGRPIGSVGLHDQVGELGREVGYWIAADHEGRGYVTEAVAALVRVGFETMELDRLEIHCDPRNERSAAVPARLGFTHESTLPRRIRGPDGTPQDSMVWTLYRSAAPAPRPIRAFDLVGRRAI